MTLPFDLPSEPARSGPERHLNDLYSRRAGKTAATRDALVARGLLEPSPAQVFSKVPRNELKAKSEGQRLAVDSLDEDYRASFDRALIQLVETRAPFTVDDIIEIAGLPESGSHNGIGGLISQASKAGWIKHVGYRPAVRSGSHARILKVWEGVF